VVFRGHCVALSVSEISRDQVRGSCSVLAAPSYTPKHVDSLSPPAHGERNLDSVGSSYATVGAVGRLWTTPLRIQTTDSATCASASVPPTVYPRSALFGTQKHVHPFDTYSIRHALNKRLSEPPAGLWTCYWLLTRPLFVFGNQFTSQALSGIYFGLPHTQCTSPRMPTGTSPDHPSPRTPFSPWNQEKEG
jgi:hypothetical protein